MVKNKYSTYSQSGSKANSEGDYEMVEERNMRLFGSSYTALIGSRNMALREAIGCKTAVYDEKNVT